jgi:Pro-kumamolisin, activation domain/Putative Ig domain/Subtilase family
VAGGSSRTAATAARALAGVVVAAALFLAPTAAPARAAATLSRVGPQPTMPAGAVMHGLVAPAQTFHITVTLRPRDPDALAAYARAVSTPGSADYRAYLTPAQFARRFGPTAAQVRSVVRALRARGLAPEAISAGGLSIPVTATAGRLEHAFAVSLTRLSLPGRRTAIAAGSRPAVAASAAPAVQAVVGLNTTAAPRPLLVRDRPGLASEDARPRVTAGAAAAGPQPCAAARQAQSTPYGQGAHTNDQIASAYGFSGIYAGGDEGTGVTVAVYELESDDPGDIAAYQACYGTHTSISYIPVDGGAGTGPGQGEAALDIENLIGFAPDVRLLIYQGPNSSSGAPGSGPYDTFSRIINQDRARVVSVSWGQCEAAVGQADAIAENTLFQQAAVEGQSIVAADGDSGAQDCSSGGPVPQTQAAVDDPSSQPYVTGVGGTTLSALGPRPTESVWNSGGTPLSPTVQPGASGGGVTSFWPMPAAQLDAAPSLGVRNAADGGAACGNGAGWCRAVPDVSADADPSTGYLVYWNGSGSVAGQPAGWQGIGGTSAAAPLWAALLALADGSPACAGSPVGFANPALYRSASSDYAAVFNDVTTGNNDFTGTNGGRYAATPGYDPVTGLGTPNAAELVGQLCADTVHLTAPGAERSTVHAAVSLRLHASDVPGAQVTFVASGLPPGLKLKPATGVISGRPTRRGRYTVHLSARDNEQSSGATSLTWIVGGAPRLSRLSLAPAPHGGADLAFTLNAARDAPPLHTIAVTLPSGLRLGRAGRGVAVTTAGQHPTRLRFTATLSHARTITIALRSAVGGVRIALGPPILRQVGGRVADAARSGRRLALSVSVTDAEAGNSRLGAKVAARR